MTTKNIIIRTVAMALLSLMTVTGQAQETFFSQFFNNPVYYNPGLIGSDVGLKLRLQYRNQWNSLPGDFKTMNFNMDIAEREIPGSGGLALMFNRNQDGLSLLEKTTIGIGTSFRITLQDNIVTQLGFMGSYVEQRINWSNLDFTDEFDALYGHIYQTGFVPSNGEDGIVRYPDLVVGNIIKFYPEMPWVDKFVGTVGFALHHAFQPDNSYLGLDSKLKRKYVFHGNAMWLNEIGSRSFRGKRRAALTKYDVGFLYESWNGIQNYSVGFNIMRSNLYVGAWYRGQSFGEYNANAITMMLGVNYAMASNAAIKIYYSYDWSLNELESIAGPTHEITLIFQMSDVMIFRNSGNSRRSSFNSSFRSSGGIINQPLENNPF